MNVLEFKQFKGKEFCLGCNSLDTLSAQNVLETKNNIYLKKEVMRYEKDKNDYKRIQGYNW